MKTDQLEHIKTIKHEGEQLIVLSERAGGVLSCRDAGGHYIELSNRNGRRIVTGRSTSRAFTPIMLDDEPGALAAIGAGDDYVTRRMAGYAGVELANADTRSTVDRLADLLGVEPTAGGLVDQVAKRIGELRQQLGQAPPPFDLNDDDLAKLRDLLDMQNVTAENWSDKVLLRLRQLETQLQLRRDRGAFAASHTADDDTTRRMARMAGVK